MRYVLHIVCIMGLSGVLTLDAVEITKKSVARQNNRLKQVIIASDLQLPKSLYPIVFGYIQFKKLREVEAEFAGTLIFPHLDEARVELWFSTSPKKQVDRTTYK